MLLTRLPGCVFGRVFRNDSHRLLGLDLRELYDVVRTSGSLGSRGVRDLQIGWPVMDEGPALLGLLFRRHLKLLVLSVTDRLESVLQLPEGILPGVPLRLVPARLAHHHLFGGLLMNRLVLIIAEMVLQSNARRHNGSGVDLLRGDLIARVSPWQVRRLIELFRSRDSAIDLDA